MYKLREVQVRHVMNKKVGFKDHKVSATVTKYPKLQRKK